MMNSRELYDFAKRLAKGMKLKEDLPRKLLVEHTFYAILAFLCGVISISRLVELTGLDRSDVCDLSLFQIERASIGLRLLGEFAFERVNELDEQIKIGY